MRSPGKLIEPVVAAAVSTVVLTSFTMVMLTRGDVRSREELFAQVWPIALSSAVIVVLVMSLLYRELRRMVAELQAREAAAQYEALHDHLTGLPNRALLDDRLGQALARFERDAEPFGVLMLDLDDFKKVNDTLGHAAGDLVVVEVARRLQALVRETDTVARMGGDEFTILMGDAKGKAGVARLCQRILLTLKDPVAVGGREAHVGVSIGAILAGEDSARSQDLLRKADITLYRAKSAGRGCFRIFSEDMDAAVQRKDRLEMKLRQVLGTDDGPDVHFQPQVSRDGALIGFECLLRWTDAELGQVSPGEIIPIAEESGLIHSLGEIVFRRACTVARDWPGLRFAVNLSPIQFRLPDLPQRLRRIAMEEDVRCSQMELEITENLLIEHGGGCAAALQELRSHGFRVALDDFGTGYSSLGYLRQFPVDKIKLDRSFIDSVDDEESVAMITAAVHLGQAMKLEVFAEGIATRAQEAIALQAGCTGLQGYLYGHAMPEENIRSFVHEGSASRAA